MPNVVVYVPAKTWKALEERGLDPAKTIREFAKKGYEVSEGQLPERESYRGEVEVLQSSVAADGITEATAQKLPRSGSCPMQPARGTKCKACGKVHPL